MQSKLKEAKNQQPTPAKQAEIDTVKLLQQFNENLAKGKQSVLL